MSDLPSDEATFLIPQVPFPTTVPSQTSRPAIDTSNLLVGTSNGQSRSAVSRRSPVPGPTSHRKFQSVSCLPTTPSASLEPTSMTYQWPSQGYEPQTQYAPQQQPVQSDEEKRSLNLALGPGQGVLDLMGMHQSTLSAQTALGNGYSNNTFQPGLSAFQNGGSSYQYRPSLALDTSSSSFLTPRTSAQIQPSSAYSSNPPSGLATDLPSSDGEVITPGLPFQYQNDYSSFHNPSTAYSFPPSDQQTAPTNYQNFQYVPQNNTYYPPAVPQQQGTISPSQLGQTQSLKPTKSFSDLMMGSRASSSSSTSAEGGQHDWSNGVLDEWGRPLGKIPDYNLQTGARVDYSTNVPGSSRRLSPGPSAVPPSSVPVSAPPAPANVQETVSKYIRSTNRLSFGERKIIIMSPKVGQKSYGTEKRFLCPHPQATLIGSSWWRKAKEECPIEPLLPPRVNISLTGEMPVKDAMVSWTAVDGTNLDEKVNTTAIKRDDNPFMGNVAGKNIHISDNDSKRREVKALVTIKPPLKYHAGPNGWGCAKGTLQDISDDRTLAVFESKEIKIISKPSKKKSSAKAGEMIITHGSTIALFNRVKSQTTSTRYLSVVPDFTRITGSDGLPAIGAKRPRLTNEQSGFAGFTADANTWESFIIWLVDPNKAGGPSVAPPPHPDWPSPPANVIAPSMLAPAIRYNSTVVLQSMQTGVISPVLIVRRIESDADAVGMDGHNMDTPTALPPGEYAGDLVSQLQKVAFELYRTDTLERFSRDPRYGGMWLQCNQDVVSEQYVVNDRKWTSVQQNQRGGSRPSSVPSTPQQRFGVLPMTPHNAPNNLPSTPSSPVSSSSSSVDYFGQHSRKSSSHSLMSPNMGGDMSLPHQNSTDGGPVRRHRTGSINRGPLVRPLHKKRGSSGSLEYLPTPAMTGSPENQRLHWTLGVGDNSIWSIVSTEQTIYTFYVPPHASDPAEPYAPFPTATRMLSSNLSAEQPTRYAHQYTSMSNMPLLTLYGNNFTRGVEGAPRHQVYYGDTPAGYTEYRCGDVLAAAEPILPPGQRVPILLVRDDGGVIVPTNLTYPQ
ncbi:hypothetical protein IAU59_003794 [Kwoniella sp. CBS 9459]